MGRYVFFKPTGLEYKFLFAVQPSEDILKYGGYLCLRNHPTDDEDDGMGRIRWFATEDLAYVKERLERFGIPQPDITNYETTAEGYELYMTEVRNVARKTLELQDSYGTPEDSENQQLETYATYILGHSIYFQLHMVPELTATYEY